MPAKVPTLAGERTELSDETQLLPAEHNDIAPASAAAAAAAR